MTATFGDDDKGDDDDGRTPYSDTSDDEFLDELRRHRADESWTLGHWVELERRSFELLDADPELAAAVRAQYDRTIIAMQEALDPIREQMVEHFKSIVPDLSGLMPKVDYSAFMPNFDYSQFVHDIDLSAMVPKYELDLPTFDLLTRHELEGFVTPDFLNLHADSVLDHRDTIAAFIELQEDLWEAENDVQRAQLATAASAAQQVELLAEIDQRNQQRHDELIAGYDKVANEVRSGHQPRLTLWLMIGLTAVAAIASLVAAIRAG